MHEPVGGRGVGSEMSAGPGVGLGAATAEFRRGLIAERARAGLASARHRSGGRPTGTSAAKLRPAQAPA